ncbi:hypothetical protein CIB84_014577, partial [Bambusicola thoracicus]
GLLDLLNFDEFKTLLNERVPNFLSVCGRSNPGYLKMLFEETDVNKDREVTFKEFTTVLAKVTDDAHRLIHKEDRWLGEWGPFVGEVFSRMRDPKSPWRKSFVTSVGCQTQGPLSELEKAIDVIIDVFHQYSRREGDKDTLTKKELKLLIEKQLANYLKVSRAGGGLL